MIQIDFLLLDDEDSLSGFELGNIEIKSKSTTITANTNGACFMVFISISDFLDQVSHFCSDDRDGEIKVFFCDSSFYVLLKKKKNNLSIQNENTIISGLLLSDFCKQLYLSSKRFYEIHEKHFTDNNSVSIDLSHSLNLFYNNVISKMK